ncbi:hypothetical protein CEK29_07355 [Bordetella genomosp. 5]|uniref:DUF2889 domain-containing protein n=1 Tax=Bordetella genomosp. 5 TaxID=1395608 RepID=A0A261TKG9_9BORD|nr:DUF2889 domain-containing protein [Bordetella genomosp. 5]OZI44531.1 hypothetical protein CEK29_07355 [Bordetella genomosp. 5]OZI50136.1 hypothetical protein CAL25_12430 [Bordetella genomosp. 5]
MPLPLSEVSRQPLHTRSIRVQCYGRDDGLWDLEAELIDVKGYDFLTRDGETFKAGDPIHHMHLRITIDDDYSIVAAVAAYDAAPYGGSCMAIADAYEDLVGMNLLKGFRRQVKERFGHVAGCTHMTELSQVLPTAAVQMMAGRRRQNSASNPERRPFQLDGCHALRTDGPVVLAYYPQWYTGEAQGETVAAVSDSPSFSHTS